MNESSALKNTQLDKNQQENEPPIEGALRPLSLDEFIGQKDLCDNLNIFVKAAKARSDAMDHVLLYGPPGLGKTTLAQIVAKELGVGFRATSGPVIAKSGDLAAILTNLQPHDVLFIDEIHRLNPAVEEILYPAMEDRKLDLIIGEGPAARSIQIELAPFTLVGATTRSGLLTNPLRDRFGIPLRLEFYNAQELAQIVARSARLLETPMSEEAALEIAKRSRGTPRIAGRLTRRVRDFFDASNQDQVCIELVEQALSRLDVDRSGLDSMDRRYMSCIVENYGGGPVGVETIAAVLSEGRDMIEDVIEPYLMQKGLIQRTPRGRMVSLKGFEYLGITPPNKRAIEQLDLLED